MGCPRPNTPRSNPYDLGELEKPIRDRLYTLFHDAPNRGLTLVSGYRDPGRQWDLRTPDRGIPAGQQCNPAYKGRPPTATPAVWNGKEYVGGSDHQRRLVGDIGGRDLQWAIDNRARYGLGLTVRTENWHYKASGTDVRTGRPIPAPSVRILEYPGKTYDNTPAPAPKDWFDMATRKDLEEVVSAQMASQVTTLRKQVDILFRQIIGTKDEAPAEALRQLWRDTAVDADDAAKQTRKSP